VKKIYENRYTEITIHGLGAALPRAVDLALCLKEKGHYVLSPTTSTVKLVDDILPVAAAPPSLADVFSGDAETPAAETEERFNSAIHIVVSKRAAAAK